MNKEKFFKNALGIGALTAILYLLVPKALERNYLKSRDFNNSNWIEFYNKNGRIWTPYMKENIPHNQINWHSYFEKVNEKNKGKLEGNILLPDLDKNGIVGK